MCGSLITNRQGAGLIVGEHGTGKTTIMRRLYSLMRGAEGFQTAIIETAEHSPTIFQLVKEILETFGQECVGRDTQSRMDQLKRFLADKYRENQTCVLMIDEAQQMRSALLESLRGLLNFETNTGGKLLQILLFAMPQIMPKRRCVLVFQQSCFGGYGHAMACPYGGRRIRQTLSVQLLGSVDI